MPTLKIASIFFSLFMTIAPSFSQEVVEEDTAVAGDRAQADTISDSETRPVETAKDTIKVECVCTAPETETSLSTSNQMIPVERLYFVAPAPKEQQAEEAKPDSSVPPGYENTMPRGYSNSSYKQIE